MPENRENASVTRKRRISIPINSLARYEAGAEKRRGRTPRDKTVR